MPTVISVEHLSKAYRLGQIGTGTLTNDMKLWWAKMRGKPNPLLRIGETDHGNRDGETIWALKDVSFNVEQGEVLGIIGRNGAGKSTLLKILSRVTAPTSGRITGKGRIASLLEVGTGFHPELTGRENIYLNGAILGMSRREIDRKFDEIVDFAEIEKFIDTPVKRYSSGMYVRLAFAVAAHLEPEILVVDEVLAVGDAEFQKKCLGKMGDVSRKGRTVLFVSHNMSAIEYLCTKAIYLHNGQIRAVGLAKKVVEHYLASSVEAKKSLSSSPHIVYESVSHHIQKDFAIVKLEVLDQNNQPCPIIQTWDTVKFKIFYSAKKRIQKGSLVLQIADRLGTPLLLLSTQPDSKMPMSIEIGQHFGIVEIEQIPLAAGDYIVGSGLAIPNKEWLTWDEYLAIITIHPRDVFDSGLAPNSSRAILALPHRWEINQDE